MFAYQKMQKLTSLGLSCKLPSALQTLQLVMTAFVDPVQVQGDNWL